MYYAPHTLQVKRTETSRDDYGRVMELSSDWETVGMCRCDDNTIQEFRDEVGKVFRPKYHIVADGKADVFAGDCVRCLNADGSVRGEVKIYNVKKLNVLKFTDIWV